MNGPRSDDEVEAEVRRRVRALVEERGSLATASALRMVERTVLRLAGGARVRRGTVALAEQTLAALDAGRLP